jgi:hypothetical protein
MLPTCRLAPKIFHMTGFSVRVPVGMLLRRPTLLLVALTSVWFGSPVRASAAEHDADMLVGAWRLVSYVDTPEGAAPIYAFGKEPIGLWIFTADGHFSISIMRNPPDINTSTTDPDPDACIPGWYCTYFGTYTVSGRGGLWVAHVIGSNIPTFIGTDQTRAFSIRGNKLVVSEQYLEGGKRVHTQRVLVREGKSH